MPAAPLVVLTMSGGESDFQKFLDAVDKGCKSTDLFSVATPAVTYVNYSIERYSYQRSQAKGAHLLTVEIELREVRQVSVKYGVSNKPKDAGAAPKVDGGKVQPQTPPTSTLKSLSTKIPALLDRASQLIQGALR